MSLSTTLVLTVTENKILKHQHKYHDLMSLFEIIELCINRICKACYWAYAPFWSSSPADYSLRFEFAMLNVFPWRLVDDTKNSITLNCISPLKYHRRKWSKALYPDLTNFKVYVLSSLWLNFTLKAICGGGVVGRWGNISFSGLYAENLNYIETFPVEIIYFCCWSFGKCLQEIISRGEQLK